MHFKKSNDNQSTILHEGSVPYLTFKKIGSGRSQTWIFNTYGWSQRRNVFHVEFKL